MRSPLSAGKHIMSVKKTVTFQDPNPAKVEDLQARKRVSFVLRFELVDVDPLLLIILCEA